MFERENLPYRQGAIGIILNKDRQVLIVQLTNYRENQWRFPGGGLDDGESSGDGLLRELSEELGSQKFRLVRESKIKVRFEWPEEILEMQRKKRGTMFRGQEQAQWLVEFTGEDDELVLQEDEIRAYKWVNLNELEQYFVFDHQYSDTQETLRDLELIN